MKKNIVVMMIAGLFLFSSFNIFPVTGNGNDGVDADVYVDDDASPSWYDATHVKTIQEGVDNASSGDTVYVYKGIYYENVEIDKKITIHGEHRDGTVIDGNGSGTVVSITASWVNISGFTMQKSGSSYSDAGIKLDVVQHCHITNITVSNNNQVGIWLLSSSNNTITSTTVSSTNDDGIVLYSSSDNTDTTVNNNSEDGIMLTHSSNNTISGNIIINNKQKGALLQSSSNNLFRKNNFMENEMQVFFNDSSHNCWWRNYWDNWPGLVPKPIFGARYLDRVGLKFPKFNFDMLPARKPYDIDV